MIEVLRSLRTWWTVTPQRRLLNRQLRETLPALRGVVLDIGGGRAAVHDRYWDDSVRRLRLDISSRHGPDVIGDALSLPLADSSFDAVVAFEVLEHVSDPAQLVRQAFRVLRPGGYFCASAPFIYPVHGDPNDFFRFTGSGLRALAGQFDDVTVAPYGNHWSAAWVLISTQSRVARLANPLMRYTGLRTNPVCPGGHIIVGRKPTEPEYFLPASES